MTEDKKQEGCLGCAACLLVAFVVCVVCPTCNKIGSTIQYSDGTRDGTVQKFSHKGMFFKTWEGELLMDGFVADEDGLQRRTFYFTVDDPQLASQIQAIQPGQRVRLHYRQMLRAWSPNGDTLYFITAVETK